MACRRTRLLASALFGALSLGPPLYVYAQSDEPTAINSSTFSFDFSAPPAEAAELAEVQLHFSVDLGRTWKLYRGVSASDGKIAFEAAGDGEYWFAVQQVYRDGRRKPSNMENATPQRKVIVDATPPRIDLRPTSGGGKIGVEWSIRGDDADLNSLRLQTRAAGKREWTPISVTPTRTGRKTWDADSKEDHEIRMRIADRAGNEAAPAVFASPNRTTAANAPFTDSLAEPGRPSGIEDGGPRTNARPAKGGRLVSEAEAPNAPVRSTSPGEPSSAQTFCINRMKFNVNYKLEGLGKSGCKAVHLYWRHPDDEEWTDYGPNAGVEPPYKVMVTGEGKYGIRLRAVSGVGLAEEVPRIGSPPQLWVVVDLTPPTVQFDPPQVRFTNPMEVALSWRINDENPGVNRAKLLYAALDGPDAGRWKEIAKGLPDAGTHRWRPPADAPYRFKIRLEAEDAAGNVAHEETANPVSIDDSRPKAIAIKVEPIGDGPPSASGVSADSDADPPKPRPKTSMELNPDDLAPAVEFGKKLSNKGSGKQPGPLSSKSPLDD